MTNLTGKIVEPKPSPRVVDPAHMARVAKLPCAVCERWGHAQKGRTQVHHCIHGRYGTRRAGDDKTIPLCEPHHQGLKSPEGIALHRDPAAFKAAYGQDTDYLPWVQEQLERITNDPIRIR